MPLPNDEVTPPVTKMYLVMLFSLSIFLGFWSKKESICTGFKSTPFFNYPLACGEIGVCG
jgi:hypothetical protein